MSENLHLVCPHCAAVNRLPANRLEEAPLCGRCGRPLFDGQPREVDETTLQKHLARNDIPVLVDFWAPWCGPCKMMAPAYAQATARLEPGMRLLKLNTELAPHLAAHHQIRSIPTLALFVRGQEVARQSGALDTARLIAWAQTAHAAASRG